MEGERGGLCPAVGHNRLTKKKSNMTHKSINLSIKSCEKAAEIFLVTLNFTVVDCILQSGSLKPCYVKHITFVISTCIITIENTVGTIDC